MNQHDQAPEGPASLNPRSAGCMLTAVAVVGAVVAAWLGLRLLQASSGDMALAAARNGVGTAGLYPETRDLIEAQLVRVEEAHSAGDLTPAQVISAVDGLLQTPCLPSLRLRQILEGDLPASGLSEEQRAGVAEALSSLWQGLLLGEITVGQLSGALGLVPTPKGETAPPLSDADLLDIQARALEARSASTEGPAQEARPFPDDVDLFRLHVDTVLAETP